MERVERLTILISQRVKSALRQVARLEGETMAVIVRRAIREVIRKYTPEGKENSDAQKQ